MVKNMPQSSSHMEHASIRFEPGTSADSYAVFLVFERAYADLLPRLGIDEATSLADPAALARIWRTRQPLYDHLAATADQFWVARRGDELLGFSRSIVRDGLRLLTELFILPDRQSAGLGRELLARAMPAHDGPKQHWLLATNDLRAQALYLKNGLYPQFPVYYFWREPRDLPPPDSDLDIRIAGSSSATIQAMGAVDAQLLNHRRDIDHQWLLTDRQGYLYLRAGQPVGYGYVGHAGGPFALLDAADYPAVLVHAEGEMARLGQTHFGLEVPMVNHQSVDYLLKNSFRISRFMAQFMGNGPSARFSNYIMTSPPFIL